MIKFDPMSARKLISTLSSDDSFREQFTVDPIGALEQAGLMPPGEDGEAIRANSSCLMVTQLASKSDIRMAAQEIDRMLTSGSSQTVPALDAGLARGLHLRAA